MDWWALRDYAPPESVSALAADVAMTDSARRIFYVNHPRLLDEVQTFREACPVSEQSIVLGCYHSGQRGIFIYEVQTNQLHGVEQVTAAHEMLHAVYERLGDDERERLNRLLTDYYENELTDERVQDTIKQYQKNQSDHLLDEMHSIFGTELAELPAELEQHYSRYFSDRPKVVAFSEGYEDEFTNRVKQINEMDGRLATLKQQIDSLEASLSAQAAEIDRDRSSLDSLRDSGNISAYNGALPSFNAKVNSYNAGVRNVEVYISQYNRLVEDRNELAAELRGLNDAIDTRLERQTGQ